ncbi:MAG: FCD domain-containing protein [Desulfarculaceae bacterium]|nr:FCD domain-containing protein [Desulfarculaceae bacterium]MCF8071189.1 FCD domain-containing protein [Desulfarculaceae bacterium]MCF8101208.1 FCD domain-containing protein [Desulfarculaceae bacterium]MCF8115243.1 FCD domain-containing protein [Desulfarculaceae bacterium]
MRKSIFNGEYQPGQRLPNERELAETFGTSRIIVREAIWDLKKSGLVEVKRGAHGGAFVQEMSHDAVASVMRDMASLGKVRPAHIIEVRLLIEPAVAALAAERAGEEDLAKMSEYLEVVPKQRTDEYVRWQIGFHRMVGQASQNPLFAMQVNIFLDFSEDMILNLRQKDRVYHGTKAHPAILEKIVQRDPEGAQRLLHDHLLEIKPVFDDWEKNFGNNGLVDSEPRRKEQA